MDTDKLKYFVTVAEIGSLTKASEILRISHSGISKAISSLEIETNLKLFRPEGRGLAITDEGKWFYLKAKDILQIVDEVLKGKKRHNQTVRIGVSGVVALTCSGLIASELKLPMSIIEVDVGDLEGKIVNGELDFGIAFIPSPKPELEYLKIGSIKFNSYGREDLVNEKLASELPFVVPNSDFPFNPLGYKNRDGWPAEVLRHPFFAVSGFAIALNLLREGQGIVYMPDFVAQLENATNHSNKIVKVNEHSGAESIRQIFLVKSRSGNETKEMKKVTKVIRSICCNKK